MKQKGLRGWTRVFGFTLGQTLRKKGWLLTTLLPTLLLLLGIPTAMLLVEQGSDQVRTDTPVTAVFVTDQTAGALDYQILNYTGDPVFHSIHYTTAEDLAQAEALAADQDTALILVVDAEESGYMPGGYLLRVVTPEGSALTKKDAADYGDFLERSFSAVTVMKSGVDLAALSELCIPVSATASSSEAYFDEDKGGGYETIREVAEVLLPYLGVMVIYFLVLFYGNGVAGSVIMEKTSKLMDTVLLSLEPAAMILGKLLASALAGLLQLAAWIFGGVGGCVLGKALVLAVSPNSNMAILHYFNALGEAGGMFSAGGVAVAAGVLVAGFLLYCAVASISGALASKPEDLSSTNMIFILLLVFSFIITFFGSSSSSTAMISDAAWLNYVPFTAILCVPARALLGQIGVTTGLISLVLILAVALLAILLAGKLYTVTTFWQGNPPKITDIPKLLKKQKA